MTSRMSTADELAGNIRDLLSWRWAAHGRGKVEDRVARPPNRHERRHAAALQRQRTALLRRMAAHQQAREKVPS